MFKQFKKKYFSALLSLVSLSAMNSSLSAEEYYSDAGYYNHADYNFQQCCNYQDSCCDQPASGRIYIGAFGGEVFSNSPSMRQTGTAFFIEAQGGPLAVDARGRSRKKCAGFGGVQIGYALAPKQMGCSNWSIVPAAEVEALFYSHTREGLLINPTERIEAHDFLNSFSMDAGVYLVNGVVSLKSCHLGKFSPYLGAGVGAARISMHKAYSLQVDPPEPGVNHFNSKRSDSSWTFAAQGKAGLGYDIFENVRIFGEYRFLYLDTSRFNFGSTVFPGHAATTTWNVDVNSTWYNAFSFGIQFSM